MPYKDYTARRDWPCARDCGEPIKTGTRYVYSSLPPWADGNESDHWVSARIHGRHWEDCPSHAALLAQVEHDTRRKDA